VNKLQDVSEPLSVYFIPKRLAEAFDNFIAASVSSLEGISSRKEWAKDERDIVEWLESSRGKPTVRKNLNLEQHYIEPKW
jgi:hypothetical protein